MVGYCGQRCLSGRNFYYLEWAHFKIGNPVAFTGQNFEPETVEQEHLTRGRDHLRLMDDQGPQRCWPLRLAGSSRWRGSGRGWSWHRPRSTARASVCLDGVIG